MAPGVTVYAKDLEAYTPVIDARRLAKPTIIAGQNFLDDIDGPRSAFATNYANFVEYSVDDRVKQTELRVGDDIWYGTPKGVYRHDPVSGDIIWMITGIVTSEIFWPWSTAQVGGSYYFAQYGIGLWQYNPITNVMAKISTPVADINVKYICESHGRLVMLFSSNPADAYAWSALDNGADFVPSLVTGAGAQTCGLVGRTGYRIDPVADGFIVSCSTGVIKATYVATNYLWQHRVLSKEIKLFSPNGGCVIPDVGVLLADRTGIYITNGGIPTPWQPLMSEYFRDNLLNQINAGQFGGLQLYYSTAMKAIWVAFAPNSHEGLFSSAYVWLTTSQRWGVFNKSAWSFFDVLQTNTGVEFPGYMSFDGYIQYFIEGYSSQTTPAYPYAFDDVVWRPVIERAPYWYNVVLYGETTEYHAAQMPAYYDQLSIAGLYAPSYELLDDTIDDDQEPEIDPLNIIGVTNMLFYPQGALILQPSAFTLPSVGLNASLEVGPFRFTQQLSADETSFLSGVILGITPVGAFVIVEDWNILQGNEDWNAETGYEDWGAGQGTPDNFQLELMDTNDGFNPQSQGLESLYVVNNMGGSLMYSPRGWSSIYHRFKLSATEAGEGFALKYVDLAGELSGRLTFNG